MERDRPETREGVGVWQRSWKWVTSAAREGYSASHTESEDFGNGDRPQFERGEVNTLLYPYLQTHPKRAVNYALQHVRSRRKQSLQPSKASKLQTIESQWRARFDTFGVKPPIELTCPICMELLIGGVSTLCGHTFCWQCLDQALLINPACPVCRSICVVGSSLVPIKQIIQIVKGYAQLLAQCVRSIPSEIDSERALLKENVTSQMDCLRARIHSYKNWVSKRLLTGHDLHPSDMVDIRDTQHIWCSGIVKRVLNIHGEESILVHYLGWSSLYDQIIPKKSHRLASYRFYTGRKGIPRYEIEGGGQLQGYVLHNSWQHAGEQHSSEDGSSQEQIETSEVTLEEYDSEEENPEDYEYPHLLLTSQLAGSHRDHSNKH